ncbi:MAG: polysaccharide deacetylase [Verrucomicrobiaceae bacterium]|nr:polysaccharide deacetylase [Verrucomicrobiaceae bacterium]
MSHFIPSPSLLLRQFVWRLCYVVAICAALGNVNARADASISVPVLCYHRFGPTVADSMTVTTAVFESHLKYLKEHGFTVIPLQALVDYKLGKAPPPPPRSVVITVDDGHRSVYEQMLPLVQRYHVPVTLFIYPSAISNSHAPYAMSWEQLRALVDTGLFSIQSHTYWHPNFKREKKRLEPAEYDKFVVTQLQRSKAVLEKHFGSDITVLAWPFGIYDDALLQQAHAAGYQTAFSIDGRQVHDSDALLVLPRFLMNNAQQGHIFEQMVASPKTNTTAQR